MKATPANSTMMSVMCHVERGVVSCIVDLTGNITNELLYVQILIIFA